MAHRISWIAALSLAAGLGLVQTAHAQDQARPQLDVFAAHTPESQEKIDYSAFDDFMNDIVFDVGFSDRRRASSEGPRQTGSRIVRGSRSPYRYEGNRLLAHLVDDERIEGVIAYRDELAVLPDQLDLSRLNRDEQLAYWLNLYTAAIVAEILADYPVGNLAWPSPDSPRALLNRHVVTVSGVDLSLNDIRLGIVGTYWDDPRVIYGFWHGAIGGPSLRAGAYDADRVWSQLDRQAREFVNALRGVEADTDVLHVSDIYFQHRDLFPRWPEDLREHLRAHGSMTIDSILARAEDGPEPIEFEWDAADLTNGTRCGSLGAARPIISEGRNGFSFSGGCNVVPEIAVPLINRVLERRMDAFRNGAYEADEIDGQIILRRRPRSEETPSDDEES